MSAILVTGGAGYIGSHACKALSRAGYTPVCYDNLERGHPWAVNWGPLEQGDILDRRRLDEVLRKYKPEAVMHFAGYIAVGESVEKPELYHKINVDGSHSLLEAMVANGVNKIIFSSSAAIYGIPEQVPIPESHPLNPINPYGKNKLDVEHMLHDFEKTFAMRSVSLRYFNAAGADPDGETGESHNPETHLIPLVLESAAGKTPDIRVFGKDYDTPDGTCIRDYIHVTDLVDAHMLALGSLLQDAKSATYNLGTGTGYSVLEVIAAARKVTGKEIPVMITDRRPGDATVLVCNSDRARSVLTWQPKHSDLETIINTAWQWHKKL